ncbi:tetratricopeptide repeat protein [Enterobacter bugandensis]|uniref:tetratricopeptide repeat protein n=1 Tax=Enterobacter TaxID=547 RepID=UPI0018666AA2|nr:MULTISPECIES: tetratricopeptide repeat protein [Enterobacter]MBE3180478.1 sel1 repeat family protein [Enterobacter cloacae complex sp. P26RS]MBE3436102.1 sel1 repeat family protein [Enterobacter cloacae complex sp. P21RS]MBE3461673.1 sel1 repeat family protein [Enterobacter cloacae complex sp. P21C]MBE3497256.1 sel1 repeat family protein [Enterobacter cloacae complex sp. P2B]MBE3504926.1 sel1 repeat family protein [Enterobacter cloacae complex sp. I11]
MKAIFLLMLFFTSFARADEIGSQYQKQAEAGDARAQYYLADTYFSSGDRKQAALWAEKAAKGGDVDAMGLLSQILFTQGDYAQAKALAQQATIAGSKRGTIMLARIMVNTQAGKTDYPQAIKLLQTAAEDIDNDSAVDAQLLLGLIYANGVEVPQDDVQAASWFKRSSSLSRTGYAEYWAGMLFQQGEKGFITPNKQKALYWLNLSCTEGFDTGCEEFDALSGE